MFSVSVGVINAPVGVCPQWRGDDEPNEHKQAPSRCVQCFSKMLNASQSVLNSTAAEQYQGLLERLLFSTLTTAPCCVFLFINVTMLFTLRSKAVFRDTCRYVLLFNLLLADTLQMTLSQLLYIIAACRTRLTYPMCGVLNMLAILTNEISPLTLVVMSLERYVAVCYPLRHAAIVTIRNTSVAIALVWFSITVTITSSYVGVMVAARSASADKASARKARNTLLLHLVQLGLSLSSTVYIPILTVSRTLPKIVFVRIQIVFFFCIFIVPRCLSSLIYGIRDQTIRPALMYHLCCRLKLAVVRAKPDLSPLT
ncbi:hypothetical protein F2P81_024799 [Scophthalmus maximus]|uniref:G-protein coupled receptors family 1 profile domain-containing protein n=1 Tax=Scophthalmus maximus TaxID=52904 RepID=A0A6A4RS00_SCOMX|nr:hypothetical protein F2P81_024799 [Scophthalmus maximus]